jgi:signal transduction histidine kinase
MAVTTAVAAAPVLPAAARARRLGLGTAALCAILVVALLVADRTVPAGEQMAPTDLVWMLSLLTYPVVGTVIVARQPLNRVGWIYLVVGAAFTLALILSGVADVLTSRGHVEAATLVERVAIVPFALVWGLITTFAILLFPDGHLPSRRWRPVGWAAGACILGCTAVSVVPALEAPALVATALVTVVCLVSVVVRWRSGDADDRRRLAWVVLAVVVMVVTAAAGVAGAALDAPEAVGVLEESVLQAAIPVGAGLGIVRAGLFDIEVVLDRALVYVGLIALVLGTYAAVVAVSTRAVDASAGQAAGLLAAVAVGVSSGTFTPRLVAAVDRRLFGQRSSPYTVLSHVTRHATRADGVEELLDAAARSVAQDLRLPYVEIVAEPAASTHAEYRSDAVVVDIVHRDRREGVLVAGLRRGQRRFTPRETDLLEDLCRQLAVTMRAVRLANELQDSRERIVRAREEERRRIRRDLHDGLGPVLAAAGLQVDTLRDHLAPDDRRGRELLDRMGAGLRQGVSDVRRTVEGLRPPALDQIGLAAVVREHAAALDGHGLAVMAEVPETVCAPAAVEVAAYRIILEALTNVTRHAGASRCTVRVVRQPDAVVLEVTDDGVGLRSGTDGGDGVGLSSMRERAEELGGRLLVRTPPGGGTCVRAVIPVVGQR